MMMNDFLPAGWPDQPWQSTKQNSSKNTYDHFMTITAVNLSAGISS